jgi:hypothetical protein
MAIFNKPKIGSKLATLRRSKGRSKAREDFGKQGKPVDTAIHFTLALW